MDSHSVETKSNEATMSNEEGNSDSENQSSVTFTHDVKPLTLDHETEDLAVKETRWVMGSKLVVVLVLCVATAVTAFFTHAYTSHEAKHVWVAAVRFTS